MRKEVKAAVAGVTCSSNSPCHLERIEIILKDLSVSGVQLVLLPGWEVLNHLDFASKSDEQEGLEKITNEIMTGCNLNKILDEYCFLARSNRIFLGVNLPFFEKGKVFNRGYLISDKGEVAGWQDQIHFNKQERMFFSGCGEKIEKIVTPLGNMGFLLGSDVFYPEIARILSLQGAEIILAPTIYPEYSPWDQLAGAWQVAQQNQFFLLENPANLKIYSLNLQGVPAIYGPCEVTNANTGFLAGPVPGPSGPDSFLNQAEDFVLSVETGQKKEYHFSVVINYDDLKRARTIFPVQEQMNKNLYRSFLSYEV